MALSSLRQRTCPGPGETCSTSNHVTTSQRSVAPLHHHSSSLQPRLQYGRRQGSIQFSQISGRALVMVLPSSSSNEAFIEDDEEDAYPAEFPTKFELMQRPDKQKPLVKVRLSVHYRVHSRQMLCIGGSQIPFGWSFLSIAKVPMTWNTGDIWTCEVRRWQWHRGCHRGCRECV